MVCGCDLALPSGHAEYCWEERRKAVQAVSSADRTEEFNLGHNGTVLTGQCGSWKW